MFKNLISSLQGSGSSEEQDKKEALSEKTTTAGQSWRKTLKKVDAAIPRKRALSPINGMGVHSKKNLADRTAIATKKNIPEKNSMHYWRIFMLDGKAHLLYEKEHAFFVKNLESRSSLKKDKAISIVNSFSYDVDLRNISQINISQVGRSLILNYRRDSGHQEKTTAFAAALDNFNFREVATSETIKNNLVFAKKDISQGRYHAYTGENFIYFASADSLKNWEIKKEYLLTPRQKFFDFDGLKMLEAIELTEGILLLYESSCTRDGRFHLQIGGALFEKEHPDKLLWRSEKALWEQSFPADAIEHASAIGAFEKNGRIMIYYVVMGELMTVDFRIPVFHPEKTKIAIINRHCNNPIIGPKKENPWESKAVFNAAAIHANGKFHLLYRAIGEDDVSALGYACSDNGFDFDTRLDFPVYVPREKFEGVYGKKYIPSCKDKAVYESGGGCSGGCEDPRLTRVGDTIYVTYVAYNGHDVPGVAISSIKYRDFINHKWNWDKARLISKPGEIQKNWVIFPEKINGKFAIIHGLSPKVHIEYVASLEDFGDKNYIESLPSAHGRGYTDPSRQMHWDNIVRGTGAPPIKTKYGWLVFYHAMDKNDPNRYKIGAMILDYKQPEKILYRSRTPILAPDEAYENEGMKAGVVYMCGAVVKKDMLHLYYGGADMVMCVATSKLEDFLEKLVQDEKNDLKKLSLK